MIAAASPTIVATSAGVVRGTRTRFGFGPVVRHAVELAGVSGHAPRLCYVGTAMGDDRARTAEMIEAGTAAGSR